VNPKTILALLRIPQYIKNLFIFAPLFFSGMLNNPDLLIASALAFFAFSLGASAVYIFNDYQDVEQDKLHPKNKNRPLASETISVKNAFAIMFILFSLSITLMAWLSASACLVLVIYFGSNIAYSLKLKHVAIIDVSQIALGFVFRLFIGSLVTGIALSHWIVTITFLLALFLSLAKRRDDVLIYKKTGIKNRKVIDSYNLKFLDIAISAMSVIVITAYIIFTSSDTSSIQSEYLYLTSFFVVSGILRYLHITLSGETSGDPTQIILHDTALKFCILSWLLSFSIIIYT
jgi:4-hydroxybenzoate polyprenyltransferase